MFTCQNHGNCYDNAHEIQPYMFEPNPGENQSESSMSSEEEINEEFEAINSWRLSTLEWCKCGHRNLMTKTCNRKLLLPREGNRIYDEYDDKLKSAEHQNFTCVTELSSFLQNISQDVLDVDVSQYVEENWPLDDSDLARMHKLYRLVAYRRRSRWIFHILGKNAEDHSLPVFINA